jgi:hypothetical protein
MNTIQMYFRVNPKDQAYVKFLVESYEGLAAIRTVDPREGIMEWMIPPDLVEQAEALVESLRAEISIEQISPPDKAFLDSVEDRDW